MPIIKRHDRADVDEYRLSSATDLYAHLTLSMYMSTVSPKA